MNETPRPAPEGAPLAPAPALDPGALARLERLTRDYARLSEGQGGLSALLGGGFLWLVALVESLGHGGRLAWMGALAPLPLAAALGVTALPFLWLGARALLRRWASARFGQVEPVRIPDRGGRARARAVAGRFLLPGGLLLGLWPILARPLSCPLLRASLLVLLALAMHLAFPRLRGRLERFAAILLLLAPGLLLSGIQLAAGDTLLAYPLGGACALVLGLRDHLAFRRVRRELEFLGAPA